MQLQTVTQSPCPVLAFISDPIFRNLTAVQICRLRPDMVVNRSGVREAKPCRSSPVACLSIRVELVLTGRCDAARRAGRQDERKYSLTSQELIVPSLRCRKDMSIVLKFEYKNDTEGAYTQYTFKLFDDLTSSCLICRSSTANRETVKACRYHFYGILETSP